MRAPPRRTGARAGSPPARPPAGFENPDELAARVRVGRAAGERQGREQRFGHARERGPAGTRAVPRGAGQPDLDAGTRARGGRGLGPVPDVELERRRPVRNWTAAQSSPNASSGPSTSASGTVGAGRGCPATAPAAADDNAPVSASSASSPGCWHGTGGSSGSPSSATRSTLESSAPLHGPAGAVPRSEPAGHQRRRERRAAFGDARRERPAAQRESEPHHRHAAARSGPAARRRRAAACSPPPAPRGSGPPCR